MSSPSEDEDRDLHLRAIEVVKALDGLKINSALRVLDHTAKAFLCGTHVVDAKSERFTAIAEAVRDGKRWSL